MGRFLSPKHQRIAIKFKTFVFRYLRFLVLKPHNSVLFYKFTNAQRENVPQLTTNSTPKVACILDEFSYECFRYEGDFHQLNANSWRKEVEDLKPDMIFVESAWRGKEGTWRKKISEISNEIIELIAWARQHSIPTVFWHKEVPPHFYTFLHVAKLFDYVFLTDGDCIPAYKKKLGHPRVHYLPFACQPRIHNPITSEPRKDAVLYAGSFYPEYKYPERHRNFIDLFDTLIQKIPIDIFDRNADKGLYTYPERYREFIRGSLPFSRMSRTYREYNYGLNMNSVKTSETMCARRVFELIASNTFVIGNFSKAVHRLFGDVSVCSDSAADISKDFERIRKDRGLFDEMRRLALRRVLSNHTYEQRLKTVFQVLGHSPVEPNRKVIVLGFPNNDIEAKSIEASFRRQSLPDVTLVLFADVQEQEAVEDIRTFSTRDFSSVWSTLQKDYDFLAYFDPHYTYGDNYLLDLLHGFLFQKILAVTKATHFAIKAGDLDVENEGWEYQIVPSFRPEKSLVRNELFGQFCKIDDFESTINVNALSIDRFNICRGFTTKNNRAELCDITPERERDRHSFAV